MCFLTGAIPKREIFQKFLFDVCVCMFFFDNISVRTDLVDFRELVV